MIPLTDALTFAFAFGAIAAIVAIIRFIIKG